MLPSPGTSAEGRDDEHRRRVAVLVHLGIGDRGPPGQDVRPDLRRHPRRDHPRRSQRPRRLRDGDDDRPRPRSRRDHDEHLYRLPDDRPRDRPRHRLHEGRVRVRLPDLRHARLGQGPVAGYRAGRECRPGSPRRCGRQRDRRGRPGDDVRLRLPRDAGADAAPDRARPPDGPPARRGPQVRAVPLSPSRRQDPGDRRVRARRADPGPDRRRRRPARPGCPTGAAAQRHRRGGDPADDPGRAARDGPDHARQPDGPVRHRRADGRRRADRSQDHRRQLWRDGAPRWWRLLGQGSDEGGSFGGIRGPVGRQERGCRRPCGSVRGRARLRNRDRAADLLLGRIVRHRADRRRRPPGPDRTEFRPAAIIAALDLRRPIYRQTAAYGHFGRPDLDLPWERTDKAALLASEAGMALPEPVPAG
jgi:hypothetical protein